MARGIGLYANSDKAEFMCFNPGATIFLLNSKPLKLVDTLGLLKSQMLI